VRRQWHAGQLGREGGRPRPREEAGGWAGAGGLVRKGGWRGQVGLADWDKLGKRI
jgi:hypothetical protein